MQHTHHAHRGERLAKAIVVGLLLPVVAIATAGGEPVARADDQVVTSTADDGTAGTLRAAFIATNASGGGTITIMAGTITLTSALPVLTASTTITGAGAGETVIDTDGYQFIYSVDPIHIAVSDITLTGNTRSDQGAMIFRDTGTTTLERVEVTGNSGAFLGIVFQKHGGVLRLVDSTVHDNSGSMFGNDHGNTPGGDTLASPLDEMDYHNRFYITSSAFHDNTDCVVHTERFIHIENSSFTGNSGVCLGGLNRKTVRGSTFTGNATAMHLYKYDTWDVPVVLDDVTISDNTHGVNGAYTTTAITNSTICGNGVDLTESGAEPAIIITNSQVGGACPVPTTTTTVAPVTTTTAAPTTITAAPTTTTAAPTTTAAATTTAVTTTTSGTVPVGSAPTVPVAQPMPRPLEPRDVVPVTGLSAGEAYVIDGTGSVSPIDIHVTDGRHVLSSERTSISVSGDLPSQAGSTLVLRGGGTTQIDGADFLAGSTVKVWLFSEPTLLGEAVADLDGSFRISASIPTTMTSGAHTIVVSGVRADGNAAAVALGVTVTQAPGQLPSTTLPSTGFSTRDLLLASFVLVFVGVVMVTRRRPVS